MNKKRISLVMIIFFMIVTSNVFATNKLLFKEPIAPGVVRYKYEISRVKKNTQTNVVTVDLNNPHIKINTVAGGGTYTNKATVSQMADRTNAVALVNGDFFTMQLQGVPLGASIIDGDMKSSPAVLTDIWSFGIDENNMAFIDSTKFVGSITAPNGKSYPIDGLNKTFYWYQPSKEYSHESKIQMYDSFWSSKSRGDKTAGEVLLSEDNVVEQIVYRKNIDMKIPKGKKILQVSGGSERFVRENIKVGDKVQINTNIEPNRNWKMMIGGHALLVENGAIKKYTKDVTSIGGIRARTAVGISKDGKTVYIVSCEGRTKRSAGLSLNELSQFMLDLGAFKAMNLDGGGSTAMAVRNLGDIKRTRVTNPERNAAERKVVNGLGVFNTTTNTGVISDVKFESDLNTIVGEQINLKLKSAWDEFLNPIDIKDRTYTVADNSNGANILKGLDYLSITPGKFNLALTTNKGENINKEINIADPSKYSKFTIDTKNKIIKKGMTLDINAKGEYNNRKIKISPRVINYSFEDMTANVDPNNFKINILDYGRNPKIIAKLGNKTSILSLYDESTRLIKMKINDVNYSINGESKKMDAKPFIKNNRTLVPLRFVVEALGGEVNWDGENRLVRVNSNGKNIELKIDSPIIKIDGKDVKIDQAAIIKGDRTYVPIRFIAENLDMVVNYINESREIEISSFENKDTEKKIETKKDESSKNSENNNSKNLRTNSNNKINSKNENNQINNNDGKNSNDNKSTENINNTQINNKPQNKINNFS
ncbi:stalk domain-containing protein [uncultured Peptoniphilus sp.]|uniref:stalk domain-containing protein n=1 Tax=uncultured Peptoniphilus sp. TaxID=254354 RepID=UPI00258B64B0|nr:stalk domain-containing protein [uncultured Peptoniphilus sp.]MDU6783662.1 stalk domain-containing protein [Peptoniphilus harei]